VVSTPRAAPLSRRPPVVLHPHTASSACLCERRCPGSPSGRASTSSQRHGARRFLLPSSPRSSSASTPSVQGRVTNSLSPGAAFRPRGRPRRLAASSSRRGDLPARPQRHVMSSPPGPLHPRVRVLQPCRRSGPRARRPRLHVRASPWPSRLAVSRAVGRAAARPSPRCSRAARLLLPCARAPPGCGRALSSNLPMFSLVSQAFEKIPARN
jgi:hypothetical protein